MDNIKLVPKSPARLNGASLQALRLKAGLSTSEAAEQIGVSLSTLHTWERGDSVPVASRLRHIAAAYDVEIPDLLTDPENSTLAAHRARLGMLQKDVAALLGVSASAYGLVETGRQPMPPRWRPILLDLFVPHD